ncbi:hypothetical protein BDV23DRAFT_181854 [Aspergillus alliaceus]|uniref:Transcription factor domain-containing protein n=1 Tax=Petromyces alliaceus TaxID=209559 RepID=A0A5N7CDG5_PETAA|nr:hypothetical protein BDV23DRAFT_181854 [Aspergillus alliaceus]
MASASQVALQLGLHQIDSPANKRQRENAADVVWVDLESKRRIWCIWLQTDWYDHFLHERTSVRDMSDTPKTDDPSNANDRDINSSCKPCAQQLETVLTDMTYSNLRSKIPVIFREIVDATIDSNCVQEEFFYELVLAFDKRLNDIMKDVPACFRADPKSRAQSKSLDLRLHRLIANAFNRLRNPYLARRACDPKYSYCCIV